jgi:hypothetical protein
MNRKSVSTQILLYFLMLMLMMVTFGCSKSDDAPPATTYSIAGAVTGDIIAGVTINLTGAATATTTTAADGTYSFTGRANGTYTVTPVLSGYIFYPTSTVLVVNGSNMIADFVASENSDPKFTLSGTVTLGGVAQSGVKITLSDGATGETTTLTDGTFSFANLVAGNYTVTPYLSGYAFSPDHLDVPLTGDSTGNNFTAAAQNFTQGDLEGTWNMHSLETGSWDGWARGTVTIAYDGAVTFDECRNSDDITTCPAAGLIFTIDQTTGVITESGTGANSDNHYTMASNKTFIAGTQHSIGADHPGLMIAQKKDPLTAYADSDLYNKSFVYHRLSVGSDQTWEYGSGTTNGSGAVTPGNYTDPSGTHTSGSGPGTISVSSAGVVTFSDDTAFSGFLSADKRTIVGTETQSGTYSLMIIQITNNQSSSTSGAVGTWYNHMLTVGSGTDVPFWAHQSIDITSAGVMIFDVDDWVASSAATGPDSGITYTLSVGSLGTATITQSVGSTDFHGQVSYDGTFMIGTQTFGTGAYSLMAVTKASSTIIPDPE